MSSAAYFNRSVSARPADAPEALDAGQARHGGYTALPWAVGLRRYLSIVLVIAAGFVLTLGGIGCNVSPTPSQQSGTIAIPGTSLGASTENGMWVIEYHIDGSNLSYAVMSGPSPGEGRGHVRARADSLGSTSVTLRKPDGNELSILGSGRVFQITSNHVFECPARISASTFQTFLDSMPKDYSIASLLQFAKTPHTNTTQASNKGAAPTDGRAAPPPSSEPPEEGRHR